MKQDKHFIYLPRFISKLVVITLILFNVQFVFAGVIISTEDKNTSNTIIYQRGIAVYLTNGKAELIIDTNSNNCISINHDLKRYIFIKCNNFKSVVMKLNSLKQQSTTSLAVQEMMSGNQPPKTPITVKRSGRGSYQGYHVDKFQFIVDSEVVSEYWLSGILNEKITKEIDIKKVETIFKDINKTNFSEGLNAKISSKYEIFKKNRFALKEYRYTGAKTKKTFRRITIKRVKIRKYMPPQSYSISYSEKEFFKEDS